MMFRSDFLSSASLALGLSIAVASPALATPATNFGALYSAVELNHVFSDSKTFADAVPNEAPAAIMADYARAKPSGREALRQFVTAHFTLPAEPPATNPVPEAAPVPLAQHITDLWPTLTRPAVEAIPASSAISLPRPYVVPGGRFREIYYWDSYFTMLGLARDGRGDLVESMIDDFTSLIERYGHIPNGTRDYYLSRSQPPVFWLMVSLSQSHDPAVRARRLAALRREHDYWMQGAATLRPGEAVAHVVRLHDGRLLNRYWDALDTPRDESYAEDIATAARSGRPSAQLWRDLRGGAESGWDYSSRWLADGHSLATIRTTALAPVDLNALLYGMETYIAQSCAAMQDVACARRYHAAAEARAAAIRATMWDAKEGRFADLEWRTGKHTPMLSAATLYPLFTGLATPAQAHAVAATTRARLLAPGGLRTTAVHTGQQWDTPNGWAPLQWIAVEGLRRSGEPELAQNIATRWIANVATHYRAAGTLVEKYDVETVGGAGGGGEYALQAGFGWTNGVTRALIDRYGMAQQ